MNSLFKKIGTRPFIIAGPCSAETEEQVLMTAKTLAPLGIDLFRAGVWKPRTRPGAFEGMGEAALPWLQKAKSETGLKTTIEVATANQVELALKHEIDVLWVGARTTVNPFSVQEIAESLRGVKIPVMVKNPVNPDLELWIGAVERLQKVGIQQLAAIHRGFSTYAKTRLRNQPYWEIPIELRRRMPDLPLICDNSHICGNREDLLEMAQQAMDLNYDGLMTETHPDPDNAWSDARQQITPDRFGEMMRQLIVRRETTENTEFLETMEQIRHKIDELDHEILQLIGRRMRFSEEIGKSKHRNNVAILQTSRWIEIFERARGLGGQLNLSEDFIRQFISAIHQESIRHQRVSA